MHKNFGETQKKALKKKIQQLASLGCDNLAILFDDMSGEVEQLAQTQIEISDFIRELGGFKKYFVCPSYYCFDPILEKVFGAMPQNYLRDLGEGLHPDYDIFWTGEKVCSTEYSREHLQEVEQLLCRKPFLWDNYPVNDGAAMSQFLHLKAVEGRQFCQPEFIGGIAVNPMNEAFLSTLAMASLSDCIELGAKYQANESLQHRAKELFPDFWETLIEDIPLFQEKGLKALSVSEIEALKGKYQALRNEQNAQSIDELLAYLDGEFLFDIKEQTVPTQQLWE